MAAETLFETFSITERGLNGERIFGFKEKFKVSLKCAWSILEILTAVPFIETFA